MIIESNILLELKRYFHRVETITTNILPFDFIVYTQEGEMLCYIIIKCTLNQQLNSDYIKNIANKIQDANKEQVPVLLLRNEDEKISMGILCYWEYGRYIYNKEDIHWFTFEKDDIELLQIQLNARRMKIKWLPDNFFRIVKTIRLNATTLVDAEIVYLRRFTETYKMRTKLPMTDIERFNRLLTGTPESEYPNDELDKLILKNMQRYYPSATVKSKSLLFETELLNLRLYKDKLCKKSVLGFMDIYRNMGQIELECYYYPNFRYIRNKPTTGNVEILNIKNLNLCHTYEPLSAMNI